MGREAREVGAMDIQDAFNYGMAVWGETGDVDTEPFARVIELHGLGTERDGANYHQCVAVAGWAVGDKEMALQCTERARGALGARKGKEFSCWRYYRVAARDFLIDLDELEALIHGDASRRPQFMTARADPGLP